MNKAQRKTRTHQSILQTKSQCLNIIFCSISKRSSIIWHKNSLKPYLRVHKRLVHHAALYKIYRLCPRSWSHHTLLAQTRILGYFHTYIRSSFLNFWSLKNFMFSSNGSKILSILDDLGESVDLTVFCFRIDMISCTSSGSDSRSSFMCGVEVIRIKL